MGYCCHPSPEIPQQPSRLSGEAQGLLVWPLPFPGTDITDITSGSYSIPGGVCHLLRPPSLLPLRALGGVPRLAPCCPVVMVGPSSCSSHLVFGQIALDGGLRLTVPSLLSALLRSQLSALQRLHGMPGFATAPPATSVLLCPVCLLPTLPGRLFFLSPLPSRSWRGSLCLLPACLKAGAVGRVLAILSGWQPITPVHAFGGRWMGPLLGSHMHHWWISGSSSPAVGTLCACAQPWSR